MPVGLFFITTPTFDRERFQCMRTYIFTAAQRGPFHFPWGLASTGEVVSYGPFFLFFLPFSPIELKVKHQ